MGKHSRISWTHHTFNPWWGCEKISPGCAHCYAATLSSRYGKELWGKGEPREQRSEKYWSEPLKWNRAAEAAGERQRVFTASMADVFEDRRDLDDLRLRLWGLILRTPWLNWLLLTKRPEHVTRLWSLAEKISVEGTWPPENIWLGTTVENQECAEKRIPELLSVPGVRIRFLSAEPLLGPIDLRGKGWMGCFHPSGEQQDDHSLCAPRISWIIAGGESGTGARPMHPDWARSLRDQCQAAGVPFFFKQWGEWQNGSAPAPNHARDRMVLNDGSVLVMSSEAPSLEQRNDWPKLRAHTMARVGTKAAGALLDGRAWEEVPV